MNGSDPLAQLRDIHLPEAVSQWPLAPGWWLLALLFIVTLATLTYWLWRHYQRTAFRKTAFQELATTETLRQQAPQDYLQQLNVLLKRTALLCYPQQGVAGLSGQPWLAFLDRTGKTDQFSQGPGQILLNGPYQTQVAPAQLEALTELCHQWLRRQQRPC